MGLLDELDKYHSVFELIKNDESYNKKKSVLTGEEVFKLCQDRYKVMQGILRPLKKRLGENIEIIDIGFVNGMQGESIISIKYNKDDKLNGFSIINSDFSDIEIKASDDKLEKLNFVLLNKGIIKEVFDSVDKLELDQEIRINSTSKKFVISDILRRFIIKDATGKLLTIEGSHPLYIKEGLMYSKESIITPNPKLKELLENEDNIMNIYRHLRVYEEDIPKTLKKLINN